jgi:hypothetical protein
MQRGLRLVLHALKLSQMYAYKYYSLQVGHYYQEGRYYPHRINLQLRQARFKDVGGIIAGHAISDALDANFKPPISAAVTTQVIIVARYPYTAPMAKEIEPDIVLSLPKSLKPFHIHCSF